MYFSLASIVKCRWIKKKPAEVEHLQVPHFDGTVLTHQWCHDIHCNDIQRNDTKHDNNKPNDIQHIDTQNNYNQQHDIQNNSKMFSVKHKCCAEFEKLADCRNTAKM